MGEKKIRENSEIDKVILISALEGELAGFYDHVDNLHEKKAKNADITYHAGVWNGVDVIILKSDMGLMNASTILPSVIETEYTKNMAIIGSGLAGGLIKRIKTDANAAPKNPGRLADQNDIYVVDLLQRQEDIAEQNDIVVVKYSKDSYAYLAGILSDSKDFDLSGIGMGRVPVGDIEKQKTEGYLCADPGLERIIIRSAIECGFEDRLKTEGFSATSPQFINMSDVRGMHESEDAFRLRLAVTSYFMKVVLPANCEDFGVKRYPAIVDMEDFAVMKVGQRYGIPVGIYRVVSDDRSGKNYDFIDFLTKEANDSARLMNQIITRIGGRK